MRDMAAARCRNKDSAATNRAPVSISDVQENFEAQQTTAERRATMRASLAWAQSTLDRKSRYAQSLTSSGAEEDWDDFEDDRVVRSCAVQKTMKDNQEDCIFEVDAPVFFMIGAQRSGSNWLRTMLNEREDLAGPHPPHILRELKHMQHIRNAPAHCRCTHLSPRPPFNLLS